MFTVRKISFGIGVERAIPMHSPRIEKLEVIRSGHVRRSRLYFLRDRTGKAARLDEKVDRREEAAPLSPPPAKAKAALARLRLSAPRRNGPSPDPSAHLQTFQVRSTLYPSVRAVLQVSTKPAAARWPVPSLPPPSFFPKPVKSLFSMTASSFPLLKEKRSMPSFSVWLWRSA